MHIKTFGLKDGISTRTSGYRTNRKDYDSDFRAFRWTPEQTSSRTSVAEGKRTGYALHKTKWGYYLTRKRNILLCCWSIPCKSHVRTQWLVDNDSQSPFSWPELLPPTSRTVMPQQAPCSGFRGNASNGFYDWPFAPAPPAPGPLVQTYPGGLQRNNLA